MKNNVHFLLFIFLFSFYGCNFIEELRWDLPKLPEVIIYQPGFAQIQDTTVVIEGEVIKSGGIEVIQKGICYSNTTNPNISNKKIICGSDIGSFSAKINGLTPGNIYYCRAYATNKMGTAYSEEITFTTKSLPKITTKPILSITNNTAITGGIITNEGSSKITQKGICYNTLPNPNLSSYRATNAASVFDFNVNITGLNSNTTYYVRAFATNSSGTAFGNEESFRTLGSTPTLTTLAVSNITNNSARTGGNITVDGGSSITSRGVCFSKTPNPTTSSIVVQSGSGTGSFNVNLTNLTANTTYYVRAYAINSTGTAYGNEVSFKTSAGLPILSTNSATEITINSAKTGGNISSDGGASIISKGVCYSTSPNPTTSNSIVLAGSGSGSFNVSLSNLVGNTTYYVRAYATNSAGTSYGNEVSFKTLGSTPTLTTLTVSSVTNNSARTGGNITFDGGSSITGRGVCFSTTPNPTTSGSLVQSGTGTGSFNVNLISLTANTTYYVRAYAINSTGTAYGNEVSFKTSAGVPILSTNSVTEITINSAKTGGNITSDGGASILSKGVCYSTSPNPTTSNSVVQAGSGSSGFNVTLSNLVGNTTYYVRAYATNSAGNSYGNEVTFKTSSFYIGQIYQGGIIFYLDKSGIHGLIAAQSNQSTGVIWGCAGKNISNCNNTAIGSGQTNTTSIVLECSTTLIAAKLCDNLTLNGYSDWYLPCLDELKAMYNNLKVNNLGNFDNAEYWSSSQFMDSHAYAVSFSNGTQSALGKSANIFVRAIRSF